MSERSAQDEADDLLETLVFTFGVILDSDADRRGRISAAYASAQALVATIPLEDKSARPKIVACLELFTANKDAGKVEAAGWMLAALQERIAERNLPQWEQLQVVADQAVNLLDQHRNLH